MNSLKFRYIFNWDDGTKNSYQLELNPQSISITQPQPEQVPDWARLDFHQCANCPLTVEQSPYCPMAYHLIEACKLFSDLHSHKELQLIVNTNERSIIKHTTAQRAISSLLGLIIPASGCPHTAFFKPMARFHLPLSSEDETIFRATGMYLLAQYFLNKDKQKIDLDLKGLIDIYQQLHIVNDHITGRFRAAFSNDSTVNAVILLDIFAKTMPYAIDDSLTEIKYLFQPYLDE
ncbi:MAG: hypothetical protein OQL09_03970 [Gammaproteobacteria bacterium]|nr:hypothetical protein [Gammaproteobacteria bacterium]